MNMTSENPKENCGHASGFEPDPGFKEPCRDPQHHAPSMLVVRPGQRYRNVCPSCGLVEYLRGSDASLKADHSDGCELH